MRTYVMVLFGALPLAGCVVGEKLEPPEAQSTAAALEDHFASRGQNELEGSRWHDWFCIGDEQCGVGDFNGDGRDDVVTFLDSGTTYVALSGGAGFNPASIWDRDFCSASRECTVANVNGDRFDDVVAFDRSNRRVYVALSIGSSFGVRRTWHSDFCASGNVCDVGDFNGDGNDDIISFDDDHEVYVSLSDGTTRFEATPALWSGFMPIDRGTPRIGDLNADGRDDVAVFEQRADRVFVSMSVRDEDRFGDRVLARTDICPERAVCDIADVDGDGAGDLLTFMRSAGFADPIEGTNTNGDVYVSLSRPVSLFRQSEVEFGTPRIRHGWFCIGDELCDTGDFDGDGFEDAVAFLRSTSASRRGDVYVALSSFGREKDWRVRAEDLYMVRPEDGGGDEPYLIMLSYRVRVGERGSAQVWHNAYRSASVSGLDAGQRRILPAAMGDTEFPGLTLPTLSRIMRTGELPEIFGTVMIAVDSDGTPWRVIDDVVDYVESTLHGVLVRVVERGSILDFSDRSRLRDTLDGVKRELRDSLDVSVGEAIRLWLASWGDPDDVIGFHVVAALALDKEASEDLSFPSDRHVSAGVIGESFATNYPHFIYFHGDNSRVDDRVKYRSRLTFTPVP